MLPLASKGFRPFFLLAALFAAVAMPAWLLLWTSMPDAPVYLGPHTWHAHEWLFGYTAAVIAGFLLTAVGNWTRRETLVGAPLLALAALWLAGRLAMPLAPWLPRALPAVIDLAFWPALAFAIGRPLVATRNRRNLVFIPLLTTLATANLLIHLQALGLLADSARHGITLGLDVIILIILIVAGRIIPMFTRNATGAEGIRSIRALDLATLAAMALTLVADQLAPALGGPAIPVAGALNALTAALALARMAPWGTRHTLRHPLLWVLHLGYLWIPVGLALRAAGFLIGPNAPIGDVLATHALTLGAIGLLTLGMMARVTLGHTGRALSVGPGTTFAFAALATAALIRVFGPLVLPGSYRALVLTSGVLWTAAFILYVALYAAVLTRPRPDGRPG